ncbi:uncharacterized protein OCT59_022813 [Rhizophagus irregularis]|uniref:uncharacterized protein n=1 Tax=Rhizophagus irregularis TaxID=588596 RepID=UPI003328B10E|nr:hypothetical protein OCT59_000285 [Rhizophagus irregularis]UZO15316.1 hypothetical protein OCT59_006745 [Rhizophagus irregularis]UZO21340.1 hypothetical protein OCT59_013736 [Rhizophagus irregularis]UZO29334.1 hypothetical protein OCT59_022813 [Rhizophagus irregularis]
MNVNQEVDQEVATSQHQEVNVQEVTSSQNKSNIVKFVVDINKNMESLGINSLNISSNQEAILDSKEFGIFKILFNKEENTILQAANVAPGSSSLLEKLSTLTKEEFEAEIENQNNKDFLKVYYSEEEEEKVVIDFQNELNFPEIISETNLLKLDSDFDIIKENTIKTLVNHLIKVYDKILEEHIETEIRRRRKFRGYVNFLMIYQKIEVYCNLYKTRARGETIKNQTNKKIIEYSSSSKFKTQDISIFIKTGKRIEKLISLSNREWGIIDAFPNLDINFFKSTTSNAAYEVWLKLIETGLIMTKEEGQTIYNYKKIEENYLREYKLQRIYKSIQASDHDDTGSPRYYFNEDDDGDNDEMMID